MGEVEAQEVRVDVDAEERLVDIDLDVGRLLPDRNFFQHIASTLTCGRLTRTEGQYIETMTALSVCEQEKRGVIMAV